MINFSIIIHTLKHGPKLKFLYRLLSIVTLMLTIPGNANKPVSSVYTVQQQDERRKHLLRPLIY